MADIIQIRRDTAANWVTADPVLAQGEFGWEIDTNVLKLGDGLTAYTALPTFSTNIAVSDEGAPVVSATGFNFVGGGVTVTNSGGVATVTVPAPPTAPVSSVFGRTGAVVAVSGDYTSGQISYNNTLSGLAATNAQQAIDEVEGRVDVLEAAPGAPVDSVFGRTGAVVAVAGDYDASEVDYDNSSSGLAATDTQAAIDEIEGRVDTLEAAPPPPITSVFGRTGIVVAVAGDYNATQVTYSNVASGLSATTAQDAIDEVEARVDTLESTPAPVDSVFGRTGTVVAVAGDYNAAQVDYDNASSGLAATTTQAAIDEVEARVDTLEAAPAAPVDSVFGRTGAVVAVAGDYNAAQVDYDNASSGLAATTTQAAIDEVEARVDTLEAAPAAPVDSVFGRTGVVAAQASDYDADQIDFDDSNAPITAADLQAALEAIAPRVAIFEAFNTNTTTNLNNLGLTTVPILGTVTQPGPTGYFTQVGNAVRADRAMRVKISANLNVFSNQARQNLRVGFAINGTLQNFTGRSGYIRDASGHQESSLHPSQFLDLAANDLVTLVSQREGNVGTVTMLSNSSNLMIEVVELL